MEEHDDDLRYQVVVNHEEQYSIWPDARPLRAGWVAVGVEGSRAECLDHIEEIWTDLRPKSLRERLEAAQGADAGPSLTDELFAAILDDTTPDLVTRLAAGDHPVEVVLRPEPSAEALRRALERGYLHVRFPETRGGTELGVRLVEDACDLSAADLDRAEGNVHLVGELVLDGEAVSCEASVDLGTLTGAGRLVRPDSG